MQKQPIKQTSSQLPPDGLLASVFRLQSSHAPHEGCSGSPQLRSEFCNFLRSCAEEIQLAGAWSSLHLVADALAGNATDVQIHLALQKREVQITVRDRKSLAEPASYTIRVQPDGTWKSSSGTEVFLSVANQIESARQCWQKTMDDRAWAADWATLKAAARFVFSRVCKNPPPFLYKIVLASFCLNLLERVTASLDAESAGPQRLGMAANMLRTTANKMAKLFELGAAPDQAEERITAVRRKLEAVERMRLVATAQKFLLSPPEEPCHDRHKVSAREVWIALPSESLAQPRLRKHTSANASLEELVIGEETENFDDLRLALSGLQQPPFKEHVQRHAAQLALHQADTSFIAHMQNLTDQMCELSSEIQMLPALLQQYLLVSRGMLPCLASHAQVERRSYEVLVTWIGFCLSHNEAKGAHPELLEYGVGIHPRGLGVLVLRDARAVSAVRQVHQYLSCHERPGRAVFTKHDEGPTYSFGEEVARGTGRLLKRWRAEKTDAERRVEVHWDEVLKKKEEAARLKAQIEELKDEERQLVEEISEVTALERDLADAKRVVSSTQAQISTVVVERRRKEKALQAVAEQHGKLKLMIFEEMHWKEKALNDEAERRLEVEMHQKEKALEAEAERLRRLEERLHEEEAAVVACSRALRSRTQRGDLERSLNRIRRKLDVTKATLREVQRAPPAVIQPLPKEGNHALRVLFFLYMPQSLRLLARMTFFAQQVLLPWPYCATLFAFKEKDVVHAISEERPRASWVAHYNQKARSTQYATPSMDPDGTDGSVTLGSSGCMPDSSICGTHIDNLQHPEHGVWYPDTWDLQMGWTTDGVRVGHGYTANPFKTVPNKWIVEGYTAQLPPEASKLQWAMPIAGAGATTRGNEALAQLGERPSWLDKREFLAFCSLRAFPCQQLRALCVALRNRTLPLMEPGVLALVRQLLGQVGEFTRDSMLLWWSDIDRFDGFLALHEEVTRLVDEHAQKPRDHKAVPVLAELAARLNPEGAELSRALVCAVLGWAQDQSTKMVAAKREEREQLRAKRTLFNAYAVMCHSALELSADDVRRLCSAMAEVHIGLSFGVEGLEPSLASLRVQCEGVMAARIEEILAVVEEDGRDLCTDVLRAVVEDAPEALRWEWHCRSTACFRAQDKHVYEINLLRGVILVDGCPPQHLPTSITGHPMYRRIFQDAEFDVTQSARGSFTTSHQIFGLFYEFATLQDGQLLILERHPCAAGKECELQLISHSVLGEQVPVRLRELHSHWFDRSQGILVFRSISFQERKVHWLLNVSRGELLHVPAHLSREDGRDWQQLAKSPDVEQRLAMHRSTLTSVLTKFENLSFIHVFVRRDAPSKVWRVELPRYKLAFKVGSEEIASEDYRGFNLSEEQQLQDTFPGFTQYLVLQGKPDLQAPEFRLLVPDGCVIRGASTCISCSDDCGANLEVVQYKAHQRFGTLMADSIEARLQLTALYAAAGSVLPDSRTQMTGIENAMRYLQQCWVNRPLSTVQFKKLANVLSLSKEYPALEVLCRELDSSSRQLDFLHGRCPTALPKPKNQCNLAAHYMQEVRTNVNNPRRRLEPDQERRMLNVTSPQWERPWEPCEVEFDEVLCSNGALASFTTRLTALLCLPGTPAEDQVVLDGGPEFPFAEDCGTSRVGAEMLQELRKSWSAHHSAETAGKQLHPVACDPKTFARLWEECCELRKSAYASVRAAFSAAPRIAHTGQAAAFRVRRAGQLLVEPSEIEVIQCALHPSKISQFNPFLNESSQARLRQAIVHLMEIYVMEDKLKRLYAFARQRHEALLLQELHVNRVWNAQEHAEWLAFEVEGCLQIRPVQYAVAQQLIQNPGAIVQLNMGEGKTRVIIPMLLLHWADGNRVVRINALTALIDELFGYLHLHLSASLLARKVFVMPFHRQVELTSERIAEMHHVLDHCKSAGGALLVAPEHRLSLQLKWHELHAASKETLCRGLEHLFKVKTRELFDESDEVLRHKYQLIYAVGSPVHLSDGPTRWLVAEVLLRLLQEHWQRLEDILPPGAVHRSASHNSDDSGAFVMTRLIPGPTLDSAVNQLNYTLVDILFDDVPFELEWLSTQTRPEAMKEFICDPSLDIQHVQGIPESRISTLLALRGFLGCGVLWHCLEKRHLVNFGINRKGQKRLAVPFRASHTPAERTEYGHPDCAIVLTILSYYYDGLTRREVKEAFRKLLSSGRSSRASWYSGPRGWYTLSKPNMDEEDVTMLDNVEKIDLSNELQLDLLHKYYRRNMEVVNFWLNKVVFETETMQYPYKLVASAWHLAEHAEGLAHGFSGTDDNHRVLPLQVQQQWLPELTGTNGKMMRLLLDNPTYKTLETDMSVVKCVAASATAAGVRALIDCGALTAGLSNEEIARELLLELRPEDFAGVVFFKPDWKEWVVMDRWERLLSLHRSPIQAQEAFAFFDEARSRGADLALRQDAVALVTVGPKVCKDKLMQAAGRMRLLGKGQGLEFVGTSEVTGRITECIGWNDTSNRQSKITSMELLWWVMQNTIAATEEAFCEWAQQGVAFATTKEKPQFALFDDPHDLHGTYASTLTMQTASDIITADLQKSVRRVGGMPTQPHMQSLLHGIRNTAEQYGHSIQVSSSVLDEEYERELEKETEMEPEREPTKPRERPCAEIPWDFNTVFSALSLEHLDLAAKVMALDGLTRRVRALRSGDMSWPTSVGCTANFAYAVEKAGNLDDVLRPVDMVLVLPNGDWLLLSQFEAEELLKLFWTKGAVSNQRCQSPCVHLFNLTYASLHQQEGDSATLPTLALHAPSNEGALNAMCNQLKQLALRSVLHFWTPLMGAACVTACIFMGEVHYGSDAVELLKAALSGNADALPGLVRVSPIAARRFVTLRGMEALFDRSELQRQLHLVDR